MQHRPLIADIFNDLRSGSPSFALASVRSHYGASHSLDRVFIKQLERKVTYRRGSSDLEVIRQIFRGRDYDLRALGEVWGRIIGAYNALVDADTPPIVIDAGANIGASALWFKTLFPAAKIVCIEPDPENFGILLRNTSHDPSFLCVQAAIASHAGYVNIQPGTHGWGCQTVSSMSGIPSLTIDQACDMADCKTAFVIKVDIEGSELDLFSANTGWLADTTCVIVEPHDWMLPGKRTSLPMQFVMAALEREIFLLGENLVWVR